MRLYADENFPLAVVRALRSLGHDVLTTQDAGQAGRAIPDEAVLAFAVTDDRVVLTLNRRDFIKLARWRAHAGIVVCTVDPDTIGQATRIHEALIAQPDVRNLVVRVNRPTT